MTAEVADKVAQALELASAHTQENDGWVTPLEVKAFADEVGLFKHTINTDDLNQLVDEGRAERMTTTPRRIEEHGGYTSTQLLYRPQGFVPKRGHWGSKAKIGLEAREPEVEFIHKDYPGILQ